MRRAGNEDFAEQYSGFVKQSSRMLEKFINYIIISIAYFMIGHFAYISV